MAERGVSAAWQSFLQRVCAWVVVFCVCSGGALLLALDSHAQSAYLSDGILSPDSLAEMRACVWERDDRQNCPSQKDAYRELIAHLSYAHEEAVAEVLVEDLYHLSLIVTDELQDRLRAVVEDGEADPELGNDVLRWWRGVNPLPSTRSNERMEEHLRRVAHAKENYALSESDYGVDQRGEMYIRFGRPTHTTSVNFTDTRLTAGVFRESATLASSRFPDHEYWSYPHLGPYARYLFVKKPGGFQIGEVNDLVPSTARTGLGNTSRGHQKARHLSTLLHVIYGNLSVLNIYYGDMQQRLDDAYGPMATPGQSGPMQLLNAYHQGRHDEARRDRIRDESVPQQHAGRQSIAFLPLVARSARFLNENGSTRTEIYWAVESDVFDAYAESDDSTFVIAQVGSSQDIDYRSIRTAREHVVLHRDLERDTTLLEPQTFVARGDTGRYHFVLQLDGYRARTHSETGDFRSLGQHLNRHVLRLDSLQALPSDGRSLLISDLRPVTIDEENPGIPGDATPYPFEQIAHDTPLGLYFEIYNLSFGEDEQTHYTVEYELRREERRGGFRGLFGGRQETTTSSTTQHQGTSRLSQEQILLDLEEWERDGEVDVTVRVTDEISGESSERTLTFSLERVE